MSLTLDEVTQVAVTLGHNTPELLSTILVSLRNSLSVISDENISMVDDFVSLLPTLAHSDLVHGIVDRIKGLVKEAFVPSMTLMPELEADFFSLE